MNVQHEMQHLAEKQKKFQEQQKINKQVHVVLRAFEKLDLEEKKVVVNYADTIISQGNQVSLPPIKEEEDNIQNKLYHLPPNKLITIAGIMQRQIETAEKLHSTMEQPNKQKEADTFELFNQQ